MKFAVASFILVGLLVHSSSGQTLEMTKMVVRYSSPEVKPDSFAAKPKIVYRVGDKYTRIEEAYNPDTNSQTLILTREPDNWKINLANKTAEHIIDPGPSFNAKVPIIWSPKPAGQPDPDEQLSGLEFANEARYFRQAGARDLGMREIDGKQCKASSITVGPRELVLLVDPQTENPVALDVTKDGKPEFTLHYLSYETGLRFDPSLFELPEGIKVNESKGTVSPSPTLAPLTSP